SRQGQLLRRRGHGFAFASTRRDGPARWDEAEILPLPVTFSTVLDGPQQKSEGNMTCRDSFVQGSVQDVGVGWVFAAARAPGYGPGLDSPLPVLTHEGRLLPRSAPPASPARTGR